MPSPPRQQKYPQTGDGTYFMRFYFIWEGKLWLGIHFVVLFMALPFPTDGSKGGDGSVATYLLYIIPSRSCEINMKKHVQDYTNGR